MKEASDVKKGKAEPGGESPRSWEGQLKGQEREWIPRALGHREGTLRLQALQRARQMDSFQGCSTRCLRGLLTDTQPFSATLLYANESNNSADLLKIFVEKITKHSKLKRVEKSRERRKKRNRKRLRRQYKQEKKKKQIILLLLSRHRSQR